MARPRGARAWWVVVLVVCGAVIRAAAQVEAAGPPGLGARPNIVLICSDDLGSAVLDEAIDLGVPTPSLDRLAS
ncbi:MAG: hypothetical protein R3B68_06155, partial [Phycisphaerales bacterium]